MSLSLTPVERQRLFASGAMAFRPTVLSDQAERKRRSRANNLERNRLLNCQHQQAWRDRQKTMGGGRLEFRIELK